MSRLELLLQIREREKSELSSRPSECRNCRLKFAFTGEFPCANNPAVSCEKKQIWHQSEMAMAV